MKNLPTLILLIFAQTVCGQIRIYKFKNVPNSIWEKWELKSENEELKSKVLDIADLFPWGDVKKVVENSVKLRSFHLIDINSDGLEDIIFNGYFGGEGEGILFFVKSGNDYKRSKAFAGRIVSIERSEVTGFLTFEIHDYHCCAGLILEVLQSIQTS